MTKFEQAVLIIIDVQKAIDADYHAIHGPRNNIGAEQNILKLLSTWRAARRAIIHIRHDSVSPTSALITSAKRPGLDR